MISKIQKTTFQALKCVARMGLRGLFYLIGMIVPKKPSRAFFISYTGEAKAGDPLYIEKEIEERFPERAEIIWGYRSRKLADLYGGVNLFSIRGLFTLIRSEVVVTNTGLYSWYCPVRQKVLYTNHGGGLFKLSGRDVPEVRESPFLRFRLSMEMTNIDAYAVNSKVYEQNTARHAFGYMGETLKTGSARNDIFFKSEEMDKVRKYIRKLYGIGEEEKVALFAPTFRGDIPKNDTYCSDLPLDLLNEAGWTVLFRVHPGSPIRIGDPAIDVSDYQDIRDLMCASDLFLSDYSGAFWDWFQTGRPAISWKPNREAVYSCPETWPVHVCHCEADLTKALKRLPDSKTESYLEQLGSYEKGIGAETLADWVLGNLRLPNNLISQAKNGEEKFAEKFLESS